MIINEIKAKNNFYNNNSLNKTASFGADYLNAPSKDEFVSSNKDKMSSFVKEKLKDENVLYEMYSRRESEISNDIFYNDDFMAQMYEDCDFMKASSSALKRVVEDKLSDKTLSRKDRYELNILHSIFSLQDEVCAGAQKSDTADFQSTPKKQMPQKAFQRPQLAFGHVFNYGFFKKPKTRREKAEAIVNRAATAAAAESALLLQVSTTVETAALTSTTISMCHKICKTYEMPGGAVTALVAQVSGSITGKALASWALKWFPGAGNAANATITYNLHQATGRAIIKWCEANYGKPDEITDWDTLAKGYRVFSALDSLGPNPVDVLGDLDL